MPAQPMQRVLLAAAHKEMVGNLVGAVRAAGLEVSAVDLVPLALIRAIGRRVEEDETTGAEAIVSIGAGVTVIVVHEAGLPRFVRVLGTGGRTITDAIGRELNIPYESAEALKRQTGQVPDDVAERARLAMTRPVGDLVEQIRGSLDYYRGQPGTPRLLQVTLTGGGSLLPEIPPQLRDLVGLPVEYARAREQIEIGEIGFPAERIHEIDPFVPTPTGLALGGIATGRRIDLVGTEGRGALGGRNAVFIAAAIAALLVLLLGGIWWVRKSAVNEEKDRLAAVQAENADLERVKSSLSAAQQTEMEIETLQGQVEGLLTTDISWAKMLQEISRTIPNDTWLTAFQGTSSNGSDAGSSFGSSTTSPSTSSGTTGSGTTGTTPSTSSGSAISGGGSTGTTGSTGIAGSTGATPGTGSSANVAAGTVSFTIVGLDFPSVSAWIQRLGTQIPSFTNLWVPSASKGSAAGGSSGSSSSSSSSSSSGGREFVNFTSTAAITSAARSDRLETVQGRR
jgi:type IV pilus assembly protein PilM